MRGLFPGCTAPVKTEMVITSDDEDFDLSLATAARIVCAFANGASTTWDGVLSDESASSLTVTREHAAEDVPAQTEGTAYIYAEVDLPGGTVVTRAAPFMVYSVGS